MVSDLDDMFQIFPELPLMKEDCVIATIIHVEGSSYKKEGACMLIMESGKQIGLLSAGCLEEELQYKSEQVLKEGKAQVLTYDMRDETDLSWGQGAGCNGILHILLEPMNDQLYVQILTLKSLLDKGDSVLHIKQFTQDFQLIANSYFPQKSPSFGDAFPFSEEISSTKSGLYYIKNTPLFIHLYKPKPRLFIFGAGQDVKPLVTIAAQVGFFITLCDWRPLLCNQEQFPYASNFIVGFPKEVYSKIDFTKDDYVVVMTHHFQKDKELLSLLRNEELSYIGILGPRKRTERLVGPGPIPPSIFSPVGLDIGAKGAEEIAISIVAELIQVLRKQEKVRLR